MRTKLDIFNAALVRVGSPFITSVNGIGRTEEICRSLFPQARDEVLRMYEWPSATKRSTLTLQLSGQYDPYQYAYLMPTDCVYVRNLLPETAKYIIEGNIIYSDTEDAGIRYIYGGENPDNWDDLLSTAICLRLASHLAINLVNHTDIQKEVMQELVMVINEAENAAGKEEQNKQESQLFWDQMTGISYE